MEQLQSWLTHIAVGLWRLEEEDDAADAEPSVEDRARKTTLRIATAANRCSWCSVWELACYITAGALAQKTDVPVAVFLSRPMYVLQERRRLLQRGDEILLDVLDLSRDDARAVDVLAFTAAASSSSAAQPAVAAPSSPGSRDSAEQPVAQEPDMGEEEVVQGGSAAEAPDDEAAEAPDQRRPEPPPGPSPFIDPS
eukprot:3663731-Pyramimonas_sp.AAC.1